MWLPLTRLPSWIYMRQTAFIMTSLTQIECLVIWASSSSLKKIKRAIYQFCDHAFTKLNGTGITCALHPNKKGCLMQIFVCVTCHWWLKFLTSVILVTVFYLCVPANSVEDIRVQSGCVFTLKKLTPCASNFVQLYPQAGEKMSVSSRQMCGSSICWYSSLCRWLAV